MTRHWRSRDGLKLVADEWSGVEGPARLPVICLHGLTRNARDFAMLGRHMAGSGRRVLAADMRGRGRSDRAATPADYHPLTYAADVEALAEQAGIARAIFVGTSMGGLITMELARICPALVAGAVINDVGPEIASQGIARILSYAGKPAAISSWADAEDYVRERHLTIHPCYGAADWRLMARRIFREGADGPPVLDYDPAIGPALMTAPPMADPWGAWDQLACDRPVLLLRGALSDLLDGDVARRMAAAPDVRLGEVPDVGHAPMLDEPEALAAIDDLLGRAP